MRFQTTFFGVQKLCTKAYTLPLLPGQKEPVTIPVGTSVVVPFSTVQQLMKIFYSTSNFETKLLLFCRDPVYFPDPNFFDPERFSPEQKALRYKSAYM